MEIFPVAFPLVFVLLFFGYLPPRFDVVLYTDNIIGEGICSTYLSSPTSFSPFYESAFYFGSELKQVTIQGYHYDVNPIELDISDVSQVDIQGFDLVVFGIPIGHTDMKDMIPEGTFEGMTVSFHDDMARLTFDNPDESTSIGIDPCIPLWFWPCYWLLLLGVSLLVSVGLGALCERYPAVRPHLLGAFGIMGVMLACAFFCGSLPYVNYLYFVLNWLLLFSLALLLGALTAPFVATPLVMVFTLIWYIANYYVIAFRGKPVMPADLKAIGTAREVLGGYSLVPPWQMLLGVAVTAFYCAAVARAYWANRGEGVPFRAELPRRGLFAAVAVLLIALGVHNPIFDSLTAFQWDAVLLKEFHREGMVLTFLNSAFSSRVTTPEGYSREAVAEYLSEYGDAPTPTDGVRPTNIIMVMNEAFSDLRDVGLSAEIDVMPFIDSLRENTVEGNLYVSVFGGGTCNTEFEALTGNSLAFMGPGAYPYTENVTDALFSLASYFRDAGYRTDAFHANEAANWNRNMVYPNLGFERFHAVDEFPPFTDELYLHGHPADIADYLFMEDVDAESAGTPRFLFDVTMQNHSDYQRWEDVAEADSVREYGSELYPDTRIYLSLVKASDDAVQQLVETYRDSDEPTMIIFFGDHQPGLPAVAQQEFHTELFSQMDIFRTKFFIWTNYETPAEEHVQISANYLPWLILERGNFPLPPYVRMLKEVHEKYPVISSQGVMDADGVIYSGVAELSGEPLIQKYQYVQYANLFDELDAAWFAA